MQAPDPILELVERFANNRNAYRSDQYNEARLRIEFLNPFFEALGWDVNNKQGYAEAYKDVIYEDAIKVGGTTKAPDYCFRIGGTRKFFVEAKKPLVNLKDAIEPAFQLRRYAWSAKLPLSILTDFEEFAVYDCRIQPDKNDKAATARILYFTNADYAQRWDEIASVFSREAILKGSFDKYAEATKGRRGTAEVDDAFLQEIESWREMLARHLALRNKHLTQRELNFAVQMTIDRIIFLRICEDRGIEEYERLRALLKGTNVYERLCLLFEEADDRYNSGLFHFKQEKDMPEPPDTLTPVLVVDDKPLKDLIKRLYYPESPYEFSALPADVLGQVYEQFLGKVIHLTPSHQVTIEEKPEVRKAGGVYYTPTFVVDHIVKHTLGNLLEGKKPGVKGSASKLKIIDPACGSGSFLLVAYQYLLDWHRDRYVEDGPQKHAKELYQGLGGQWLLTTQEKKRILLNNIYGVDIDPQAVEVTKLSLLLKVLEGESQQSIVSQLRLFHERALPDLDRNIKCGNSLIDSSFYRIHQLSLFDESEQYRINAFDWVNAFPEVFSTEHPGFDAVIGNPPYIRIQALQEWAPTEVEYYKETYKAASKGNYDIYVVFVERGLSLLNKNGLLGFILPHKFFNAQYGQPLRSLIADGNYLSEVVHFGDQQVFATATTYTCLLFLEKAGSRQCHYVKVDNLAAWRNTGEAMEGTISSEKITAAEWNFSVGKDAELFDRLRKMPSKLQDVASIFVGLQTSSDKIYVLEEVTPPQNGIVEVKDRNGSRWALERDVLKPFLNHITVSTYEKPVARHWLIFPYRITNGKATLIPASDLSSSYPHVWRYLNTHSEELRERESGKADNDQWYGYIYRKNLTLFETPKLIVQVISLTGKYAYDEDNIYFTGGGNGPYYGVRWADATDPHSLHYLQALLTSKLVDTYLHSISSPFRGGYWSYGKRFIEQLPIRTIDFSDPADKARYDQIVGLVKQMLSLHRRLAEARTPQDKNIIQPQISIVDQEINQRIYELYGLTEAEIKMVEENGMKKEPAEIHLAGKVIS